MAVSMITTSLIVSDPRPDGISLFTLEARAVNPNDPWLNLYASEMTMPGKGWIRIKRVQMSVLPALASSTVPIRVQPMIYYGTFSDAMYLPPKIAIPSCRYDGSTVTSDVVVWDNLDFVVPTVVATMLYFSIMLAGYAATDDFYFQVQGEYWPSPKGGR